MKGTPCEKATVKQILKKHSGIDSLKPLNNAGIMRFLTKSMILLATEWGMEIDLPGESDVSDQSMKDFLNLIYSKDDTRGEIKKDS